MLQKRILCILITALLLFSDSGQFISAHTCLKDKHTSYSISGKKDCCHKQDQSAPSCTIKKNSCCETTSTYLKNSTPGSFKLSDDLKPNVDLFVVRAIYNSLTPVISNFFPSASIAISSTGNTHLSLLQVFRC